MTRQSSCDLLFGIFLELAPRKDVLRRKPMFSLQATKHAP